MSTTISDQPKWNAAVTSAKLGNGVALLSDDVQTLNEKIQAFVRTNFFQDKLTEIGKDAKAPFDIQLIFENDTIKLKKKDSKIDKTLTLLTSTSGTSLTSSDATAMKETTDLVKNMANYYLNPPTQKEPLKSSASPTVSSTNLGLKSASDHTLLKAKSQVLTQYKVQGISNPSNCCYANSTYQILSNVPSLNPLLQNMPKESDNLTMKPISDGTELVQAINKATNTPTESAFKVDVQNTTSAVFSAFIPVYKDDTSAQNYSYSEFDIDVQFSDIKNINDSQPVANEMDLIKLLKEAEQKNDTPQSSLTCPEHDDDANFTFEASIKSALTTTTNVINASINGSEKKYNYTKKTSKKFKKTPNQLLINLSRSIKPATNDTASTATKIQKSMTGIPLTLNLADYNAITTKDDNKSLELQAFTVHKGDSASGHYIAYFRKENPTKPGEYQWFCANDEDIFTVTEASILNAVCYADVLYYDDTTTLSTQSNAQPLISYTESQKQVKTCPLPNEPKKKEQVSDTQPLSVSKSSSIKSLQGRNVLEKLKSAFSLESISKAFFD